MKKEWYPVPFSSLFGVVLLSHTMFTLGATVTVSFSSDFLKGVLSLCFDFSGVLIFDHSPLCSLRSLVEWVSLLLFGSLTLDTIP
jgi:hypothetical protein